MFNADPSPNRLAKFFPVEPPEPPRQTTTDKLFCGSWACKIEMLRFTDDDGDSELSLEVEIRSTIEGTDTDSVVADLLAAFRRGGEGKVAP